jgi:F1F0 ATPase subunit 2
MPNRTATMNEVSVLMLALFGGASLGAFFFGALWWTVRRGLSSKIPAVWFLSSLSLRTSVAVAGFYFLSHGDWRNLLACLLGFLAARVSMTWRAHTGAASTP